MREAIEARGAALRYLPQYSPDLNPIEMPFSKLKAYSRKAAGAEIPWPASSNQNIRAQSPAREAKNYFSTLAMREIDRNVSGQRFRGSNQYQAASASL